jgi:hypothetical protein
MSVVLFTNYLWNHRFGFGISMFFHKCPIKGVLKAFRPRTPRSHVYHLPSLNVKVYWLITKYSDGSRYSKVIVFLLDQHVIIEQSDMETLPTLWCLDNVNFYAVAVIVVHCASLD